MNFVPTLEYTKPQPYIQYPTELKERMLLTNKMPEAEGYYFILEDGLRHFLTMDELVVYVYEYLNYYAIRDNESKTIPLLETEILPTDNIKEVFAPNNLNYNYEEGDYNNWAVQLPVGLIAQRLYHFNKLDGNPLDFTDIDKFLNLYKDAALSCYLSVNTDDLVGYLELVTEARDFKDYYIEKLNNLYNLPIAK